MRARTLAVLIAPAAVLGLTACGGSPDAADGAAAGAISVTANDSTCEVSQTRAPAGTIEFTVRNTGSKVNEFYLYAEGDRVVGEVENIAPGLTRTFEVEVDEPGTYQTACKPGMVGAGIRAPFTVTGSGAAPKSADEQAQGS
ncbi:MAG TPA: cupredoxin domain-containing protein [Dermatophilaceae bacterium]|nr:cupredoxin domain-containing protein [Dermatophilaceae bacterium]